MQHLLILIFILFSSYSFSQENQNTSNERLYMATSGSIKKLDAVVEKHRKNDPELIKIDKQRREKNPKVLDKSRYRHVEKVHKPTHVNKNDESKDQKRIHKVKKLSKSNRKNTGVSGPSYRDLHGSRQRRVTQKIKNIGRQSQQRRKVENFERRSFDGETGKKRRKRRRMRKIENN